MSEISVFTAESRAVSGKGGARATRRAGRVPAVIYGNHQDPQTVSVEPIELGRALERADFYISQFDVEIGDQTERVMAREVQFHPVTDRPMHVDFLRVTAETRIKVWIPVVFVNEELSPGLKRGGVLNVVRREIEVFCAVGSIPDIITFDLEGLEINDSIHISMIELPEGVVPTIADRDFTVATVASPTVVRDEAIEAAAAAEAALLEEAEEGEEGEEIEGAEGEEGEEGAEAAEGEGEGEKEAGDKS